MALSIHIETSPEAAWLLRPQWDALWRQADGGYSQSPAACMAVWREMMAPGGARFMLVSGREDGRLVAVWPLAVRRLGLWRVLYQIGPQAAEFSNMLVQPGTQADAWVAAMWRAVVGARGADMVALPFVLAATPLGALLSRSRGILLADPDTAPYIVWRDGETWDQYYRSLSASYRKVQNKKRRQMQEHGALAFEVVRDPARMPELIGWLLRHKRVWADSANKRGAWVFAPAYERFLTALATDRDAGGAVMVFVLTLDGAPAAIQFAMAGDRQIDWIIAGFDTALGHFSPGSLLNEHCLQWALAHGLNVGMGAGKEENKRFWSRDETHATVNYRLALTPWGLLGDRTWQVASRMRAQIRRLNTARPPADRWPAAQKARPAGRPAVASTSGGTLGEAG